MSFGRNCGQAKQQTTTGAIDVSGIRGFAGAGEVLRMWPQPGGAVTCLIDPAALRSDPALLGIVALVDCVRHGAKACAHAVDYSEEEAMAQIWVGVDAERSSATDSPRELGRGGHH